MNPPAPMTSHQAPPNAVLKPFAFTQRASRRGLLEAIIERGITAIGLTGIVAVVLIFVFVGKQALPLFTDSAQVQEASVSKMFLPQVLRPGKPATFVWQPVSDVPKLSMVPLFVGTLKVTVVALIVGIPLGVLAALFCAAFAPRRLREILKPLIELLAGIPSVVLGFFALMVLATVLQDTFGLTYRLNAVVAGLALAVAIIPVVFTMSEDALTSVPKTFREGSLALGATAWETAWKIELPAAAPGVLAACMLGMGRAIGETMVVLMASGNAAIVSSALTDSTRSLSATVAAEMGEVVTGSTHYSVLFFIGVQLFIVTFALNMAAGWYARRLKDRMFKGAA
jgi:phosphate transport system permease protein